VKTEGEGKKYEKEKELMKKRERKKIQECMKTEGEGKKYVKEIR
jgi:hypothetical protein